jgi:hypothetical protein
VGVLCNAPGGWTLPFLVIIAVIGAQMVTGPVATGISKTTTRAARPGLSPFRCRSRRRITRASPHVGLGEDSAV